MTLLVEGKRFEFAMKDDADINGEVLNKCDGRIRWSRQMDSLLSLVGYCVGLGNLWRFPYFCNRNGGGAFLIPYLVCLVLIGLPLFFLELSIGQFSGSGAMHVWSICPLLKGLGFVMSTASFICSFYFNLIIAWVLYYLAMSFYPVLPWTTCSNWWNTPACATWESDTTRDNLTVSRSVSVSSYVSARRLNVSTSAAEEFWQYSTLRVSAGLHDMGGIQWHLALALFVAWFIIFLCLIKGVKSVGKVWVEAMLQMFYSLGVTWGGLHTIASYNRFSNNCYRDAVIITFLSEGTSFYAGFAIFSVLGFMAESKGVHISEVIQAGPGLGFVVYPEALALLPVPQLWAVIFFIMLLTVGIDSQGGIYVFMLIDRYVATFSLLVVGILECVIIGWIYGAGRFSADIQMMLGRRPPVFMKLMWCFVSPVLMAICFILTLVQYQAPTYGDYEYPTYGVAIGLFIGLVSMVPVPVCMIKELVKTKGSFVERVGTCLRPDSSWGPISRKHRAEYSKPVEESSWKNFRIYKW
ncbi:sodium- and chloride-dependent glycine transporter 2-like isoform X3 [Haliotis asinina]|uniref:sodium- and chloride-dependent glycine transporter 2-like isoform X3 n=1 Tax=Haliotis asinina TaxID=109174 RepID=UPI0035323A1E